MKNWYKLSQVEKILYVMRGVSGSGKSTVAKSLPGVVPENIFSTDALISNDSAEYKTFFHNMNLKNDWTPLYEKHKQLGDMVEKAMQEGMTPIVVDNMHLEAKQAKRAVELALKNGYQVEFVDIGNGGLTDDELANRNSHGVTLEEISSMMQTYESAGPLTIEKVLGSDYPEEHIA